jgi:hypothetical protein
MDTRVPPRRFYLITHPRTASNLLVRMLALDDQPAVQKHEDSIGKGYFFFSAAKLEITLGLRGKNTNAWTEDQKQQMKEKNQECFDNMEKYLATAEADDKIAFIKEHSVLLMEPTAKNRSLFGQVSTPDFPWTVQVPAKYGSKLTRSPLNQTLFPDEFLGTWLPTFLVRHPALVFPSQYRAGRDIKTLDTNAKDTSQLDVMFTFRWTRSLYDFWSEYLGKFGSNLDGDTTWASFHRQPFKYASNSVRSLLYSKLTTSC